MSLVWYYPARGLCSSGYVSHVLRIIQGAYYHGNGGCQTVHMVFLSKNHNQRAKETVAMHKLGATANLNRAVRVLGDLNIASVPILIVIRRTECRRWNSSPSIFRETQRETIWCTSVMLGLVSETLDLLISMPSSLVAARAVIQQWLLEMPFI